MSEDKNVYDAAGQVMNVPVDKNNVLSDKPVQMNMDFDLENKINDKLLGKKTLNVKNIESTEFGNNLKPKVVYKFEDQELLKAEIENNIFLRIVMQNDSKMYIDIRKFYKGYPTKKGIRINLKTYKTIKNILDKEFLN